MFIKIRPANTDGSTGHTAVVSALWKCATADAGTTPTPYNAGWYDEFTVIDNTVAGGHTTNTDTTSTTSGVHDSNQGAYVNLFADTGVTPITGEKRYFSMQGTNTTSSIYRGGIEWPRWGRANSSNGVNNQYDLPPYVSNSSTFDNYGGTWLANTYPYQNTYWINATSEYIYIFRDPGTNGYQENGRHIAGCSNFDDATGYDHSGSGHFPAAGIWIGNTSSTNIGPPSYYNTFYSIINWQDSRSGRGFGSLFSVQRESAEASTYFLGNTFLTDATVAGSQNSTGYLKSSWDGKGFERPTLNDIALYYPRNGFPYRKYKGLFAVGTHRYVDTEVLTRFHNKYFEVGNDKYWFFQSNSQVWATKIN